MAAELNRHIDEEEIERYSLGTLPEQQTAPVEEHLLVCEECRQRLTESDECVAAMRAATRRMRSEGKSRRRRFVHPLWGAAFAALLILGFFALRIRPAGSPVAVHMTAMRGPGMVQAPAGHPLELTADLTGLTVFPSYGLEIVDALGSRVWQGSVTPAEPLAKVPQPRPGTYFVRVYAPAGELLREYGLEIVRK